MLVVLLKSGLQVYIFASKCGSSLRWPDGCGRPAGPAGSPRQQGWESKERTLWETQRHEPSWTSPCIYQYSNIQKWIKMVFTCIYRMLPPICIHLYHIIPDINPTSGSVDSSGDTHGQLEDVLTIFLAHGTPSSRNRPQRGAAMRWRDEFCSTLWSSNDVWYDVIRMKSHRHHFAKMISFLNLINPIFEVAKLTKLLSDLHPHAQSLLWFVKQTGVASSTEMAGISSMATLLIEVSNATEGLNEWWEATKSYKIHAMIHPQDTNPNSTEWKSN